MQKYHSSVDVCSLRIRALCQYRVDVFPQAVASLEESSVSLNRSHSLWFVADRRHEKSEDSDECPEVAEQVTIAPTLTPFHA
jgi:hypothetical protein